MKAKMNRTESRRAHVWRRVVSTIALFGVAVGANIARAQTIVEWERVHHTIMINLTNDFKVTWLPADFNVTNDPAATTYHLYLRRIKGNTTFDMGAPDGECGQSNSSFPQFAQVADVAVGGDYYIGVYPITGYQYSKVDNPASSPVLSGLPMREVSWNTMRGSAAVDATPGGWMKKLDDAVRTNNPGNLSLGFDLPTEIQWEFACRAGTTGTFNNTNTMMTVNINDLLSAAENPEWTATISEVAWWQRNNDSGNRQIPGQKRANRAGLYDMHGNMWEGCRDAWDGAAPLSGTLSTSGGAGRAFRGGYHPLNASYVRSATRTSFTASNYSFQSFSFRLCANGGPACDNWADEPNRDLDWPRATDMDGEDFGGSSTLYIATASELAQFAWLVNSGAENFIGKTILLLNDIDLSEFWWTPVGGNPMRGGIGADPNIYFENTFQGAFDGMDCTISGLRLSPDHVAEPQLVMGLFGLAVGDMNHNFGDSYVASIRNLNLEVEEFESGSGFAGAVAGLVSYAEVRNVSVSGAPGAALRHAFVKDALYDTISVSHGAYLYPSDTGAVGGLFGYAGVCVISNCVNALPIEAEVRGDDWEYYETISVGGIAGYAEELTAQDCRNEGGITVTDELSRALAGEGNNFYLYAGGVCGFAKSVEASGLVNQGAVAVQGIIVYSVGGITGIFEGSTFSLDDCHNRAPVTVVTDYLGPNAALFGGIAGVLSSGATVRNCSNAGDVSVQGNASAGGIVGSAMSFSKVVNCWNSGDVQVSQTGAYRTEAGGLVGEVGSVTSLENSYSSGTAQAEGGMVFCYFGALAGGLYNSTVKACYWSDTDANGPFGNLYNPVDEIVLYCASFDAAPGGTLTAYDSSGIYGGNAGIDLLTVLNDYATAQLSSINPSAWTLDNSYERGAKGYPAFGPLMPVGPEPEPDYDWYFVNPGSFSGTITNAAGWEFAVQVIGQMGDGSPVVKVTNCTQAPQAPAPLNFSGTRHAESAISGAFVFGGFGGGAVNIFDGGFNGYATSLVLPDQDPDTEIYTLANLAFYGCGSIEGDLHIPGCVEAVGDWAFQYCSFDGALTFGEGLVAIGDAAFEGCNFVGGLTIPDSVFAVGAYAFANNAFNGTLKLGDPVASALHDIGQHAFYGNAFTGSLTIPDSVFSVGAYAFANNVFNGTLKLGDSVASALHDIGDHAFNAAPGTFNIFKGNLTIPNSVVTIGDYAFSCCAFGDSGGTVKLGSSVETIGDCAFEECFFVGGLTIPDTVVTIGWGAFMDNLFDGALKLGASVETIGGYAFATSYFNGSPLAFPDSLISVGAQAFCENSFSDVSSWGTLDTISDEMFFGTTFTTGTFVIPPQITAIGEQALAHAAFGGDVVVCDGVTSIGNEAFEWSTFDRISLPSSGVSFGSNVFNNLFTSSCELYYRGKFPTDPGSDLYATPPFYSPHAITSYVTTASVDDWNAHDTDAIGAYGVDISLGDIQSGDALWHLRPILCSAWTWDEPFLPPPDGPAETWVHVDVIRVSAGGDVDLEWAFADVETRLGITTGYSYVIEVCTDLTLMNWVTCVSADLGRAFGNDSRRVLNSAMPVSDKRFFKVKALRD